MTFVLLMAWTADTVDGQYMSFGSFIRDHSPTFRREQQLCPEDGWPLLRSRHDFHAGIGTR